MTGYIVLTTEEVSKSSSEDRKDNIFQNNYNMIFPNHWQFCVLLHYNYDMLFIGLQIRPRGGCRSHTFR